MEGDRFAVEHDLVSRHRACDRHGFRNRRRDVAEVARVHAHLVADFVQLDARAIELVLERSAAEHVERIGDIAR